jgi:murein hydrolase activator
MKIHSIYKGLYKWATCQTQGSSRPKLFLRSPGPLFWPLSILLSLMLPSALAAQSKKELEDKRKRILRDIALTDKLLQKTAEKREDTYDRFLTLQNQIESRNNLIMTIGDEIRAIEGGIAQNNEAVGSLQNDLQRMKEDYGRMLRSAYRQKELSNPLLFIFSAEGLNQAFRRWMFLRKYDQFRQQQAKAIDDTQVLLANKIKELEEAKLEKERLLQSLQGQKSTLTRELNDKNSLLKTLAKDETRLKQDLQKKQAAHEALNQSIERVIQEEVRKRVEAARKPAVAAVKENPSTQTLIVQEKNKKEKPVPAPKKEATAEVDAPSAAFRDRRGRLPWPVEDGFISRNFGKQRHPTIRNIEITNNGIDIRTRESAEVRAVYDGTVAGVQFIPGHNYTVILQHGDYYTVYSNLSEANLEKGAAVKAGQLLGRVSDNPISGAAELHFEVWHQKERMNPTAWIRKS